MTDRSLTTNLVRTRMALLPLLWLASLGVEARGQGELWRVDGQNPDPLGIFVATLGDVDGDGTPDVLAAEQAYLSNSDVLILSGLDGSVIHTVNDMFVGSVGAAGDLDGDGRADFLIGDFFDGEVRAYSGATATVLHSYSSGSPNNIGYSVTGVGDVDGDGRDDFAYSSFSLLDKSVFVCSGVDGSLIYDFIGTPNFPVGLEVDPAGDVDGDGTPDILVSGQNPVLVFSGRTGALSRYWPGDATLGYGRAAAAAGDVNEDGYGDVLVNLPLDDTAGVDAGAVVLISGFDGATLATFYGDRPGDEYGERLDGGVDCNGDGIPDLLIAAPNANVTGQRDGIADLISGATFRTLYRFEGEEAFDRLGTSVSLGADLDGDGLGDPVLGIPGVGDGFELGRVSAHPGRRLFLQADPRAPFEGDPVTLTAGEGVSGRFCSLFVLAFNGVPFVQRVVRMPMDGNGQLTLNGAIPPGLAGSRIEMFAFTSDGEGATMVSGIEAIDVQ